jgi:hypothetical protein
MSSNPRFHQKKGVRKLSEFFIQSLLGRQYPTNKRLPGAFLFGHTIK